MSTVSAPRARCKPHTSALHARFADILPRVEIHARIVFRHIACPHRKCDCVAETVALACYGDCWIMRN